MRAIFPGAAAFDSQLGFIETFRAPASGEPAVHVELKLDGFTLGIATHEAARLHHGLRPEGDRRGIEIMVWTDDTDAAASALVAAGATLLAPAHDFLDGRLRAAWVANPDGNPIQLVQRRRGRVGSGGLRRPFLDIPAIGIGQALAQ